MNPRLPPIAKLLPWLPFLAGSAAFAFAGVGGWLSLSVSSLAWAGLLWACWLLGKGLRWQALGFALLLSPLAWDAWATAPRLEQELRAAPPGTYLRVGGIVRDWNKGPAGVRCRLGQVTLELNGAERRVAELDIDGLPGTAGFGLRRRNIHFAGKLGSIRRSAAGLAVKLDEPAWHVEADPIEHGGEWLRQKLADRAGYYLPNRTLAMYLPLVLDMRESTPEAREVTGAFNRVGVAHIFAISGLNVTMMYLLLMPLARVLWGLFARGQGWVHARAVSRCAVTVLLWAYIALIGFPAPAVRAAAMGSMIVWSTLWGTRSSSAYVLVLTGALMLAWDPSQIHDLSFQLSFLAYACLMAASALWSLRPPPEERGTYAARILGGALLSLLVTLCVTIGLWPLLSSVFKRLTLLVFVGNLLLVPPMGVAILPAGLAAFVASLAALGSPPETLLEQLTFGLLDFLLSAWVKMVQFIDTAGEALVFRYQVHWPPQVWFLYYAGVLSLFFAVHAALRRARRRSAARGP